MFDWLTESEWIRNLLKVKWEGIKGLSQTFILLLCSPWIQMLFKYKTLERWWHDFFHLYKWKGVLKIFEYHLKRFPIHKLQATQWFSGEKIKWLLQNIWNMSWELKELNSKSFWKLFSIWSYLSLIQIIFLQNKNIQKIG